MKTKKFKITAAILAAAAVIVLSAGGTFAYLTASTDTVTNVFNHGVINVTVQEAFDQGPITEEGVTKTVAVKNDSLDGELNVAPCYVRVALVATWMNSDSESDDSNDTVAAVDADSLVDYTFTDYADDAADKWVKGDDGYYYYTGLLEPDQTTGNLLESVALKSGADLPESGYLEINVLADSVQQAKPNAAWGNPTVNGVAIYQ